MLRSIIFACSLVVAALSHDAEARHGRGTPISSAGTSSYMAAATGIGLSQTTYTADSGHQYAVTRQYYCAPPYNLSHIKVFVANWYVTNTGASPPERTPGNSRVLDGMTIEYPIGVFTSATFRSGSSSITQADAVGDWSDDILMTITGNDCFWVRLAVHVALGAVMVTGSVPDTGTPYFEGVAYSSTPQLNLLTSGSISGTGFSSFVRVPVANAIIAQGWDGRAVVGLFGDSICRGANAATLDARHNTGYIPLGIDDTATSTRLPYFNMCASGSHGSQDKLDSNFILRQAMVNSAPNVPFTVMLSEMGINDNGFNGGQYTTNYEAYWTALKSRFPGRRLIQTTITPKTDSLNNKAYTTVADQSPSGTNLIYPSGGVWVFNANITGGTYAAFIDNSINPLSFFQDPVQLDHWAANGFTTTLLNNLTAGVTQDAQLNDSPPLNCVLAYGVGLATVDSQGYRVAAITGTGPFAVSVKTALSHSIGETVACNNTYDGLHPNTLPHANAAAAIITAKNAGMFVP